MPSLVSRSSVDSLRVVLLGSARTRCSTAYFSFRERMSSLVEAILALISSKTAAMFCGSAMVVDVLVVERQVYTTPTGKNANIFHSQTTT